MSNRLRELVLANNGLDHILWTVEIIMSEKNPHAVYSL